MTTIQIGDRVRLDDTNHPKVAGRTGTVSDITRHPSIMPLVAITLDDRGITYTDADRVQVLP